MRVLRRGSKGEDVQRWQEFLIGRGAKLHADGKFGRVTERATKRFQRYYSIAADGIVGNQTLRASMICNRAVVEPSATEYPPPPTNLKPYVGNAARARKFGRFSYKAAPTSRNPERIIITGDWKRKNIVRVSPAYEIPGNKGVWLHKAVADSFAEMWAHWGDDGLLNDVESWKGSYVPRFIRGSRKTLSNHAWGTAFDINARWNRIGHVPAFKDDMGCVRDLVAIANKHGWWWGGHFRRRRDGMHFEIGRPTGYPPRVVTTLGGRDTTDE